MLDLWKNGRVEDWMNGMRSRQLPIIFHSSILPTFSFFVCLAVAEHLDANVRAHERADTATAAIVIFLQHGGVKSTAVEIFSDCQAAVGAELDAEHAGFATFGVDAYVAHIAESRSTLL